MDWTVVFASIACTMMLNQSEVLGYPIDIGREQFLSYSTDPQLHSLEWIWEPLSWTDVFGHQFDP